MAIAISGENIFTILKNFFLYLLKGGKKHLIVKTSRTIHRIKLGYKIVIRDMDVNKNPRVNGNSKILPELAYKIFRKTLSFIINQFLNKDWIVFYRTDIL